MKIVETIQEMREIVESARINQQTIGYAATMGYLHDGHLQLVKEARKENDIVVVSIFVNPLQFNQSSDLASYPKDLNRDAKLLQTVQADYIFHPSVEEMYPKQGIIHMSLLERHDVLCGKSRPGHFEGVLKVMSKMFSIIQPHRTYFGLKDAQQVAIMETLITDLNFNIDLVPVPTIRESDGLAMSSRNVRLTAEERREAPQIYNALLSGQDFVKTHKNWTKDQVIGHIQEYLNQTISGKIDYVDCLSYPKLKASIEKDEAVILAVAVYYKESRLIDNIIIDQMGEFVYRSET